MNIYQLKNLLNRLKIFYEFEPMIFVVGVLEAIVAHDAGGVLAAVLAGVGRLARRE
jgi:hypothetical protein